MYEEKLLFKSKPPILFYVSFLIIVFNVLFLIIKEMPIEGFFIYPPIIALLLFATFARYACIVEIYDDKLIVKYLSFWNKDKVINLKESFIIDLKKNYWSFDPRYNNETFRAQIFYDTLFFIKENCKETIRINTRWGHFNKMVSKLQELSTYNKAKQLLNPIAD